MSGKDLKLSNKNNLPFLTNSKGSSFLGAGEFSEGVGGVVGVRTTPGEGGAFSFKVIISELELPPPEIISVSSMS